MRTRAVLDGDHWVLNGTKCWITNAGVSTYYTVMAVTDPDKGANGISAFVVHKDDPGFSVGAKERKLGIKGSPTCEIYFEDCTHPGRPHHRRARHRLQDRAAHARPHPAGDRRAGARHRAGRARRGDRLRQGAPAVRQGASPTSRASSSCSPTWRCGSRPSRHLVYAAAARAERDEPNLTFTSAAAKVFASDTAMSVTTDAVQLFGGVRLHQGLPGRADDARREDHPDLRGHQPDQPHGDGPQPAEVGA